MSSSRWRILAGIVVAGALLHVAVIAVFPVQRTFGDEASYTLQAHRMMESPFANLLPGNMISHHRPSLGFSYFSLYAQPDLVRHPKAEVWIIDSPHDSWSSAMTGFLQRVATANIVLLSLASLLVFWLCRECGFRYSASATAAALMMFNPRVGFYVQSVWPEVLHFTLVLAGFALFAMALRRQRDQKWGEMLAWLLVCGLVLAYARLTRGVVGPLVWVFAAVVAWGFWRQVQGARLARRLAWALLATATLWVSFEGTLWPQRQANLEATGSTLVGHNLWRNIEGGIGRVPNYAEEYMQASSDPLEREAMARERVIERVLSWPIGRTISRQFRAFFQRLTYSYYERGLKTGRWEYAGDLDRILYPVGIFSWCLFAAGLVGIGLRGFQSPLGVSMSLFALYYMAGLLLVIPNPRMLIAVVPFLAIFSAGTLDAALAWLQERRDSVNG